MKQLSVFLLAALLCSCLQRPPVEGNLSLFELEGVHYIKLELRNNTDEDLYIPHMSEYYSVYDENGVECSSIYYHYDGNPSGDFDFGRGMIGPDRVLGNRDDKYYEMLMSIEDSLRDLFYLYNPQFPDSVRQVLTQNPSPNWTEEQIETGNIGIDHVDFWVGMFDDGMAVKAGETMVRYDRINNFEVMAQKRICFLPYRENRSSYYPFLDSIKIDGYYINTRYPESIGGYKVYKGKVKMTGGVYPAL